MALPSALHLGILRDHRLRPAADDARHHDPAGREDDGVDDDVAKQRHQHVPAGERGRHQIGGAQQAVHRPRLPSGLGRDPAGDHRDEAERRGELEQAQQAGGAEQAVAAPHPIAQKHQRQHQEADAHHDAEGEERQDHRRPVLARELVQAPHGAVPAMRQDEAAQQRDRDVEPVGRAGLVGDREQVQWRRRLGVEIALDGGKLGRLIHRAY